MKVKISRTRDSDDPVYDDNRCELLKDVLLHQGHVREVMNVLAFKLEEAGFHHDWTKIEYFDNFYEDVILRSSELDFKKRGWYDIHIGEERHHLNASKPEDVNLLDVLEFIVDCIVAGKSRSGKVNYSFLEFDNKDLLEIAYWNTVDLVDGLVELK